MLRLWLARIHDSWHLLEWWYASVPCRARSWQATSERPLVLRGRDGWCLLLPWHRSPNAPARFHYNSDFTTADFCPAGLWPLIPDISDMIPSSVSYCRPAGLAELPQWLIIPRIWPFPSLIGQKLTWPNQRHFMTFRFVRPMSAGCYWCLWGVSPWSVHIPSYIPQYSCFRWMIAALPRISFVTSHRRYLYIHFLSFPFSFYCTNFFLPCHGLFGVHGFLEEMSPHFWCWLPDNDLVMTWTGTYYILMNIPHLFLFHSHLHLTYHLLDIAWDGTIILRYNICGPNDIRLIASSLCWHWRPFLLPSIWLPGGRQRTSSFRIGRFDRHDLIVCWALTSSRGGYDVVV